MGSYFDRMKLIKLGKLPKEAVAKPKKSIKPISDKKAAEMKENKTMEGGKSVSKRELDVWFNTIQAYHFGAFLGCNCMECGAWIPIEYARAATAHLLPKKLFKSIATHPQNYLILGAGCGCHYKTDRVDKFVQMKVWPKAAHRMKVLIPLLPFDELKHLSSQLLTALDNTP